MCDVNSEKGTFSSPVTFSSTGESFKISHKFNRNDNKCLVYLATCKICKATDSILFKQQTALDLGRTTINVISLQSF